MDKDTEQYKKYRIAIEALEDIEHAGDGWHAVRARDVLAELGVEGYHKPNNKWDEHKPPTQRIKE